MKLFARIAIVSLWALPNCTTAPKKNEPPPTQLRNLIQNPETLDNMNSLDGFLVNYKTEHNEASIRWWADFERASLWREFDIKKSCPLFKSLSEEAEFLLKDLAYIRAVETCPLTDKELQRAWNTESFKSTPWMYPEVLTVTLEKARALKNSEKVMSLAFEKSFYEDHYNDKVQLIQESLSIAESRKDTGWIDKIRARLFSVAPRFIPNPGREILFKVANDYRKAREFKSAERIYNQFLKDKKSTPDEKAQALDGLRRTYRQDNDREKQLKATEKLAKFQAERLKKEPKSAARLKDYLDDQLLLARAHWTEGHIDRAKRILDSIEKQIHGRAPTTEIDWLRSRMEEEKGNFEKALGLNLNASAPLSENHSQWESLTWQRAWLYRKLKNYEASLSEFQKLNTRFSDPPNAKYLFWEARTLRDLHREPESLLAFQRLTDEDSFGYYGIMAHRELGMNFNPIHSPPLPALDKPSFIEKESHALLLWLLAVDETDLVKNLLDSLSQQKSLAQMSETDRKQFLKFRAQVGDYLGLFSNISQWSPPEK
jgi:hypothetical protein